MKPLICECMEWVDPYNCCELCGYPKCDTEECDATPGCNHVVASTRAIPQRLRKRLRRSEEPHQGDCSCIEYTRALIQCYICQQAFCEECYLEFAIRYTGQEFTPQTAWHYHPTIVEEAMRLYIINKRLELHHKIPKQILNHIISFLYSSHPMGHCGSPLMLLLPPLCSLHSL